MLDPSQCQPPVGDCPCQCYQTLSKIDIPVTNFRAGRLKPVRSGIPWRQQPEAWRNDESRRRRYGGPASLQGIADHLGEVLGQIGQAWMRSSAARAWPWRTASNWRQRSKLRAMREATCGFIACSSMMTSAANW
jgi:hypothetical protein